MTAPAPTIPTYGSGSWICPVCRDYNLDTQHRCAYCDRPMSEFRLWLAAVDVALADCDELRNEMPYYLHQWWDMWDHGIEPDSAVGAALLLLPKQTVPWPAHAAYNHTS